MEARGFPGERGLTSGASTVYTCFRYAYLEMSGR